MFHRDNFVGKAEITFNILYEKRSKK